MRWLVRLGILVTFGFLGLVHARAGSPVNGLPALLPLPGGIADPGGRLGFVASLKGGIEALDLVTGDVLWESIEAQVPLLAAHDRLYAQAGLKRNRLRVLVYDLTNKGECVLESDPVVFPDWVVTSDTMGRSFHGDWRLERDDLVLAWEAKAWYTGKARPTLAMEAEARKQAAGLVRINLLTGHVKMLPAQTPAPVTDPLVLHATRELQQKAARWQGMVGAQYKALVLEQEGELQKLVLMSWGKDGAETAPHQELLKGRRLQVLATLDNRYLCVRDGAPSPDQRPSEEDRKRLDWSIYAVATGELLTQTPHEAGTQAVMILGSRLLVLLTGSITGPIDRPFVNQRILKAIDVNTGKLQWQHTLAGKAVVPPEPPVKKLK
jgi:hypothetical protein